MSGVDVTRQTWTLLQIYELEKAKDFRENNCSTQKSKVGYKVQPRIPKQRSAEIHYTLKTYIYIYIR